jgi:hypothetical protein
VVLGKYETRVIDMASAYATLADSGIYHAPHFVEKVVNAEGEVLFDASSEENSGERRIEADVADNVTSAMQPIPGYSNGHTLAGGRPAAAKTGTHQLGDTGANRDAWMVGYTPQLSTAVWVGTVKGDVPLVNSWGGSVYGSGLPADIWKATMDGALQGTDFESFPTPGEVGGFAGVPAAPVQMNVPPRPQPVQQYFPEPTQQYFPQYIPQEAPTPPEQWQPQPAPIAVEPPPPPAAPLPPPPIKPPPLFPPPPAPLLEPPSSAAGLAKRLTVKESLPRPFWIRRTVQLWTKSLGQLLNVLGELVHPLIEIDTERINLCSGQCLIRGVFRRDPLDDPRGECCGDNTDEADPTNHQ